MKKILTFLFSCCASVLMAQTAETFQFVDKGGNVVADGATLTVNAEEVIDDFEEKQIIADAALSVKNTGTETYAMRINYSVQTIDNGKFQLCFPMNCLTEETTCSKQTPADAMTANETRALSSEWLPTAFGQCVATYQIELMKATQILPVPKYESLGIMGPSVTVKFVYTDPAGIENVQRSKSSVQCSKVFDVSGKQLPALTKGLNIVRQADGTVIKYFNR